MVATSVPPAATAGPSESPLRPTDVFRHPLGSLLAAEQGSDRRFRPRYSEDQLIMDGRFSNLSLAQFLAARPMAPATIDTFLASPATRSAAAEPATPSATQLYLKYPAAARLAVWRSFHLHDTLRELVLWCGPHPRDLAVSDWSTTCQHVHVEDLLARWTFSVHPTGTYDQPCYFNGSPFITYFRDAAALSHTEVRIYVRMAPAHNMESLPAFLTILHSLFHRARPRQYNRSVDAPCYELIYHVGPSKPRSHMRQIAIVHACLAALTTFDEIQVAAFDHNTYSLLLDLFLPPSRTGPCLRELAVWFLNHQFECYKSGPSSRDASQPFPHDVLKALPMSIPLFTALADASPEGPNTSTSDFFRNLASSPYHVFMRDADHQIRCTRLLNTSAGPSSSRAQDDTASGGRQRSSRPPRPRVSFALPDTTDQSRGADRAPPAAAPVRPDSAATGTDTRVASPPAPSHPKRRRHTDNRTPTPPPPPVEHSPIALSPSRSTTPSLPASLPTATSPTAPPPPPTSVDPPLAPPTCSAPAAMDVWDAVDISPPPGTLQHPYPTTVNRHLRRDTSRRPRHAACRHTRHPVTGTHHVARVCSHPD